MRTSKEKLAAAACNVSFGRGDDVAFHQGEKFSEAIHEETWLIITLGASNRIEIHQISSARPGLGAQHGFQGQGPIQVGEGLPPIGQFKAHLQSGGG